MHLYKFLLNVQDLSDWPSVLIHLVVQYQSTIDYIVSYRSSAKSLFIHPIVPEALGENNHKENKKDINSESKWTQWISNVGISFDQISKCGDALYLMSQSYMKESVAMISLKDPYTENVLPSIKHFNALYDGVTMKLFVYGGECKQEKNMSECIDVDCPGRMVKLYGAESMTSYIDLPPSTNHHNKYNTKCCISGNVAYLFNESYLFHKSEKFDFNTRAWSAIASIPPEIAKLGHRLAVPGYGIFFFGSLIEGKKKVPSDIIYLYETSTNSWLIMAIPMMSLDSTDRIVDVAYNNESGLILIIISSHTGSLMVWQIRILGLYSAVIKTTTNDKTNDKKNNDLLRRRWLGPWLIKSTDDDRILNVIQM